MNDPLDGKWLGRGTRSPYPAPPDIDAAHEAWGANCGPAAIAALLSLSLADVRPHLGDFERRRYMNPTHVREALRSLGWSATNATADDRWPHTGLAFIQWEGPWPNVAAAYRHTHWVAVRGPWLYDANADEWAARWWWEGQVAPVLAKDIRRCTGTWYVRTGFELDQQLPRATP